MHTYPAQTFALIAFATFLVGVGQSCLRDVMAVSGFNCPLHWVWMTQVAYAFASVFKSGGSKKGSDPSSKPEAPQRIFIIAMFLDAFCMICAYEALSDLSAALVQMMRGTKLIITFFVATVIMKRRQLPRQKLGVFVVLLGLAIVVLGSFGGKSGTGSSKLEGSTGGKKTVAFALCFLSELFNATYYIYQESITRKYDMEVMEYVGNLGKYGTMVFTVVLIVVNLAGGENTPVELRQITHSVPLLITCIGYIFLLTMFEITGTIISKQGSAVLRALIDVSRGALIWVVELASHWINFKLMHGVGFAIIIIGIFVNTGIITFSFLEEAEDEAQALTKPVKDDSHKADQETGEAGKAS